MISNEIIKQILEISVHAPSGDNSQPWHFEVRGSQIYIFNDPDKDLPFYNYKQCGSHVAHGALIENIVISSGKFGFKCKISLFPNGSGNELVAIIDLFTGETSNDKLVDFIKKRITNRKPYKSVSISQDEKIIILKSSREERVSLNWIEDRNKIEKISSASVVNEMTVLSTKEIHNYFFRHVLWTEKEEKEKRTGLFMKTLEMKKPQEVAFKLASYWPVMKIGEKLGVIKKIAEDNCNLFKSSSAFISFSAKGNDPEDFISVGRALQRVWLTCSMLNIAAHPITGVLFLNQIVKAEKAQGISSRQQEAIRNAYKEICNECGEKDILFLLRVGKSDPPSATSSKLEPQITFSR